VTFEPFVSAVCFSPDAQWLVTVEVTAALPMMPLALSARKNGPERTSTLKFWEAVASEGGGPSFRLNSIFNHPHHGDIVSIAHHPTLPEVVTAGGQVGTFHAWTRRPLARGPGSSVNGPAWYWACSSAASYQGVVAKTLLMRLAALHLAYGNVIMPLDAVCCAYM
jgi:hypothetical protein